jgi:predicted GNAT family N-acyltransferase
LSSLGRPRILKIIKLTDSYKIRSPLTKKEWEDYDSFRWDVLRKPLKLSHIPLKDNLEDISLHLMGIDSRNIIVSCGRLHMNSSTEAQIRYMGVSSNLRRRGIGKAMINELESKALLQGAKKIVLNARSEAVSFYASLGYLETGPYESDIQIPHSSMEKYLD